MEAHVQKLTQCLQNKKDKHPLQASSHRNLPSMIFRVEEEVGADYGHTCADDQEDEEDQQHKAVHIIDLVGPEGSEDKVDFNEDGCKGQQTTKGHNGKGFQVP